MRILTLLFLVCWLGLAGCQNDQQNRQTEATPPAAPSRQTAGPAVVEEAKEKVGKVVADLSETVATVSDEVKTAAQDKSAELVQQIKKRGTEIPSLPGMMQEKPSEKQTPSIPGTVTYQSSQGKVTFPHADHASRLACSQCHQSDPPGKIAVDKTFAHGTCRACHQNSGAGPTACRNCHVK